MAKTRILLTTTSFQDTPGEHHRMLKETGWEVVTARGPLNEADTLALMGGFDGYICGDDMITAAVIEKALPRLKVVSKYGIGVDKIDVKALTAKGIPLLFPPGVNNPTVAAPTFFGIDRVVPRRAISAGRQHRQRARRHRHLRPRPAPAWPPCRAARLAHTSIKTKPAQRPTLRSTWQSTKPPPHRRIVSDPDRRSHLSPA